MGTDLRQVQQRVALLAPRIRLRPSMDVGSVPAVVEEVSQQLTGAAVRRLVWKSLPARSA